MLQRRIRCMWYLNHGPWCLSNVPWCFNNTPADVNCELHVHCFRTNNFLSLCCRVVLEKVIFLTSQNIPHILWNPDDHEGLSPTTCPFSEQDKSCWYHPIFYLKIHFNIIICDICLYIGLSAGAWKLEETELRLRDTCVFCWRNDAASHTSCLVCRQLWKVATSILLCVCPHGVRDSNWTDCLEIL